MPTPKEVFTSAHGSSSWDESWEDLSKLDPEIFEASINLIAVPKQKKHLSAKMQSLVLLSVDCAATHLYTPGIRQHVKAAAEAGATLAEVMEVLELSSTLGIHACEPASLRSVMSAC
jgi:alkylhydroperoxidase/carboxymuconolactone decarboxylase family protein YurZ